MTFFNWSKWIGGVVFVVPNTEVDGGDKSKLDQRVFTGLGCCWDCCVWLNLCETKLATLEMKSSSFETDFLFLPEPDCIKIFSGSSSSLKLSFSSSMGICSLLVSPDPDSETK